MRVQHRRKRTRWSEAAKIDRIKQWRQRKARMVVVRANQVLIIRDLHGCNTLPGGSVHDDETFEQGAIRETEEEAGITVVNSIPIISIDNQYFHCETQFFLAIDWVGEIRGSIEGKPEWRDPDWLISRRTGSNDREISTVLTYLRNCQLL